MYLLRYANYPSLYDTTTQDEVVLSFDLTVKVLRKYVQIAILIVA